MNSNHMNSTSSTSTTNNSVADPRHAAMFAALSGPTPSFQFLFDMDLRQMHLQLWDAFAQDDHKQVLKMVATFNKWIDWSFAHPKVTPLFYLLSTSAMQ